MLVCIKQIIFFMMFFLLSTLEFIVLATILGLTLRSGDRTSLKLVLFSLILFHALSFFSKFHFHQNEAIIMIKTQHLVSIWFLKTNDAKVKSIISSILHLFCLITNTHFYRSIDRTTSSSY